MPEIDSGAASPIFAPAKSTEKKLAFAPRVYIPSLIALAIGVMASVLIFSLLKFSETEKTRSIFERNASDQWNIIQNTIETEVAITGTLRSYFKASDVVSRKEFRVFSRFFLASNKTIKALEWIPRVQDAQRQKYEAVARSDGLADFKISERAAQGKMMPADTRKEYFPVYYVEPLEGNEAAAGFDLASNKRRKAALDQARDSGKPVATAKITLVQESGKQSGFLIFDPVYDGTGKPASVQERRQRLKGFTLAVLRLGDMVESAIQDRSTGLNIRISDVTNGNSEEVLYQSGSAVITDTPLKFTKNVSVAGRVWKMEMTPSSGRYKLQAGLVSWVALLLCLLLATALTTYLHQLLSTREKISTQVEQKTSALRESESRLEGLVAELQRANVDLKRFAYVASHDLQEPLRKLQQFSEFLATDCSGELSDDAKYFLSVILKSSTRMSNLIKDLLAYSRTANSNLKPTAVDFSKVADEIISELDITISETNATLKVGALPTITADPTAVDHLIRNLIGNAIKYRHPERDPKIQISGEPTGEGGATELRIADNGIGFDMQYSERILEPFQRLHDKNEYAGSGIGLAVCNTICERHGWKLSATSKPGKGSTFSVVIPTDGAI